MKAIIIFTYISWVNMMIMILSRILQLICISVLMVQCNTKPKTAETNATSPTEQFRPLLHFTPSANWMNDPNGMVYYAGTYHLFYQYYPDSTVWGPMHWGHATSTNLVDWQHEPVALFPDSLGLIFSGSAVVDHNNTSGFGVNGRPPLVAIFTHHGEKDNPAMKNTAEVQSIAYSIDSGKTWTKYAGNPVLPNPGISDFRDPKVMWHAATQQWIMTLAVKDRIMFFSSPNLKEWKKESEFGAAAGAHGGVWECPDLISFNVDGKRKWVLLVNINPGAPNGGSGTQYFAGDFDGKNFTANHTDTRWLDYGPDNYAGVTWSNTGDRKLLIGWMSNWQYAQTVPTKTWRSAMTLPRELQLKNIDGKDYLTAVPVKETDQLIEAIQTIKATNENTLQMDKHIDDFSIPCKIDFDAAEAVKWSFTLSNKSGEAVIGGYDSVTNQYYLDRSKAGESAFDSAFAKRHYVPRLTKNSNCKVTMVIDVSSIEMFADDGLSVLTQIWFPSQPFSQLQFSNSSSTLAIRYAKLRSAGFQVAK